ncbi:MAG: glycosyltransferase family 4 protein [Candidatus Zambryskibacteria bacterium]|nr:glycosyltransferase family 4 protein [Candidatus Zambryskibacteria bacterium]
MRLLIFTQKVDKNDSVLGFFHTWIKEFAKHCESVKVICLEEGEHDFKSNAKPRSELRSTTGVEVFSLGKELGLSYFSYLKNLYKYLHKLNGSYDKVFVHMNPIYIVLCGVYFKMKGIPIYLWYVHRSVDFKLRVATLFTSKIFSSAKESFKIKTKKVVYLGHGIDINALPNTSHLYIEGVLRIAYIGRITPIKNLETLIDTGYQLKKKNLNIQIILYGDCVTESDKNYKMELEKIIKEKDLKNNVFFAGNVLHKDFPTLLSNCHITVNMSPSGGMDKAVLESILLGIPTFISNIIFSELFGEYTNLFLYRYNDSLDLTKKIYDFINMANNKFILTTLDSRVRKDFSLDHLIQKIISLMN